MALWDGSYFRFCSKVNKPLKYEFFWGLKGVIFGIRNITGMATETKMKLFHKSSKVVSDTLLRRSANRSKAIKSRAFELFPRETRLEKCIWRCDLVEKEINCPFFIPDPAPASWTFHYKFQNLMTAYVKFHFRRVLKMRSLLRNLRWCSFGEDS